MSTFLLYPLGLYREYIGIVEKNMEKNMETSVICECNMLGCIYICIYVGVI